MENLPSSGDLLCSAASAGDTPTLRSLIDAGADVSYFDGAGMCPLMHAAAHGHADAVRCLIDAGAPWNAVNPSGMSAGDLAMEGSHQDAFDILLTAGVQSELVLGTIARKRDEGKGMDYLEERVMFSEGKIVDSENKAVMMAWELPLMEAHARAVCGGGGGGSVLNVGFGMGLVDTAIQRYSLGKHTIVEAHPEVYQRMMKEGWGEKGNVRVVFGRWQDVIPQLESYDGIFFDTYGECYEDLRQFHEHLPKLLKPAGIYSFFNGLCGDNAFFHVVYCQLVALELANLGYTTQFIPLPVKDCFSEEVWAGIKQRYWQLDTYHLPVCQTDCDA